MSTTSTLDQTAGSAPPRVKGWHRRALGLVAVVPIATYVWIALSRLRYPYDLEWLEGGAVELVRRVSSGQSLYVSPSADFTPWPYPPLYFWASAGVARFTGEGYLPLRIVSFVSSLVVLLLIAAIVRRIAGSWLGGLCGAGLFAATFALGGAWADLGRVDSLFLALLLGAVLAGCIARGWLGGLAVGGLLLLAFLTKQNALIAAVPVLAWLVVFRRSVGVAAGAVLSVGAVASVVVGNALTDGWYGEYVVRELLGQPVESRWLWGFWLIDLGVPLLLALVVVGWWLRGLRSDPATGAVQLARRHGFLAAVVLGLLAAAWAGRLHSGGFANVVIPAYAAVSLLFGVAVAAVLSEPTSTSRLTVGRLGVVFAVQVALLLLVPWRGPLPWSLIPTGADRAAGDRLLAVVDQLPGRVLIPVHPYLLTQVDRPPHAQSLAIGDVLRGRDGRAKAALQADLAAALDGVSVVLLDTPGEAASWEPVLSRDFTALDASVLDGLVYLGDPDALRPVTDLAIRPTYVYVRTTDLSAVEEVLGR